MDQPQWVDSNGTMHENCRIYFLLGNEVLSETLFDPGSLPETGYRRCGVAYICPDCGQPWAHALVLDHLGRQMPFDLVRVACEKHPDQWEIPGSLLSGLHNSGYLKLLSPTALKREFVIHHNHLKEKQSELLRK